MPVSVTYFVPKLICFYFVNYICYIVICVRPTTTPITRRTDLITLNTTQHYCTKRTNSLSSYLSINESMQMNSTYISIADNIFSRIVESPGSAVHIFLYLLLGIILLYISTLFCKCCSSFCKCCNESKIFCKN